MGYREGALEGTSEDVLVGTLGVLLLTTFCCCAGRKKETRGRIEGGWVRGWVKAC